MFGRLVHEIGYVKWNTIEDEQVASLLSLHITMSGIWILICLIWKILMPLRNYMDKEWPSGDDILELPWYDVQAIGAKIALKPLYVILLLLVFAFRNKIIMEKSRGEGSLMEQDTIENVS